MRLAKKAHRGSICTQNLNPPWCTASSSSHSDPSPHLQPRLVISASFQTHLVAWVPFTVIWMHVDCSTPLAFSSRGKCCATRQMTARCFTNCLLRTSSASWSLCRSALKAWAQHQEMQTQTGKEIRLSTANKHSLSLARCPKSCGAYRPIAAFAQVPALSLFFLSCDLLGTV